MKTRRIGIVGYGRIGQYLYEAIKSASSANLFIDFVWNRSVDKIKHLPEDEILEDLENIAKRDVDLIIEAAHVNITHQYGSKFLEKADFMICSPTALANAHLESELKQKADESGHGLYVPAGAFWGGDDVRKMADQNSLKGLKVTMKKHPSSFKLLGELAEKNKLVGDDPMVLYEGPVRGLCPMAPANVNTMACAAIAAKNLGFDNVIGCLVADKNLTCHIVEIDVTGPSSGDNGTFTVKTVRTNPCIAGAVTGNATFSSFFQSILRAHGKGPGIHLC